MEVLLLSPCAELWLVVYVTDYKLSGPAETLKKRWELIRKGIDTDDPHDMSLFLGCNHEQSTQTSPWTGKNLRVLTYNMQSVLEDAVATYMTLSGCVSLRKVSTPFLEHYEPVDPPAVNTH